MLLAMTSFISQSCAGLLARTPSYLYSVSCRG